MKDDFHKTLTLDVELNKVDMRNAKRTLNALGEDLFDTNTLKKIETSLNEQAKKEAEIAAIQRTINTLRKSGLKEAREGIERLQQQLKQLQPITDKNGQTLKWYEQDFSSNQTGLTVKSMMMSVVNSLVSSLKQLFTDSLNRLENMQSYSRMSSSDVRDLKLSYGFSSSQAYGYSEAMSLMGYQSIEDLMWADQQEISLFRDAFKEYTEYYESTMTLEFVKAQLEYQIEMKKFKTELQHIMIDFIADNKDTIIGSMKAIITVASVITAIFTWLTEHFGSGRSDYAVSRDTTSVINQYKSSSKNVSVNATNTYNISQNDPVAVQNASEMAYRQAIEVLQRG